jgi:hypothetical protein
MPNIKSPDTKQPGEKKPGKFHYNPVNMAGKKAEPAQDNERDNDRTAEACRDKTGSRE